MGQARPGEILTSYRREHAKQGLSAFKQAGVAKKPRWSLQRG